jgi:hypothetical protein
VEGKAPVWSHYYNEKRQPVVTICYLDDDNGTAVGVSLCSPRDLPCKRAGRAISLTRAKFAQKHYGVRAERTTQVKQECISADGSVGWPDSSVEREDALRTVVSTDLTGLSLYDGRMCKILYVDRPGFRFKRIRWSSPPRT